MSLETNTELPKDLKLTKEFLEAFKVMNETSKNVTVEREFNIVEQENTFEILNPSKIKTKYKKNRIALVIGIEEYKNIYRRTE